MKKIIGCAMFIFAMAAASADEWKDESTGYTWSYTISANNKATITGVSPKEGINLVIPSELGGASVASSVTSIGGYAFTGCSGLTSVTIPSSVTSIGNNAFDGCSGLVSVTIPSSVTIIGDYAFHGTPFYDNQPDGMVILGGGVLYKYKGDCPSIVTIPSSVTSIGDEAFALCRGLTSVTIPSSVTSIGHTAFYGCSGLTSFSVDANNSVFSARNNMLCSKDGRTLIAGVNGDVVIPNCVTSIGDWAFDGYSGLVSVTIPSSVTRIGNGAFFWCRGLTSIMIPSSVTSIGDDAFTSCSGLTSVTIPSNVTSIGNSAFSNCRGLTSIMILEGVTSIGVAAFFGCSGLTSVTIPSSVTSIEYQAFYGCNGLKTVCVLASEPPQASSTTMFDRCTNLTKIYVPIGTAATYKATDGWSAYENLIEEVPQYERPAAEDVTGRIRELVGVPFLGVDGQAVTLDGFIETSDLTEGDQIFIYDKVTKGYFAYALGDDDPVKKWHAMKTISASGDVIGGTIAPDASTVRLPVGTAVWLERADATKPIRFIGIPFEGELDLGLEVGNNLVSAPGIEPFNLANIAGNAEGDRIVLPRIGQEPKIFTRGASGWSYLENKITTIGEEIIAVPTKVTDPDLMTISAGTGFWYEKKAAL